MFWLMFKRRLKKPTFCVFLGPYPIVTWGWTWGIGAVSKPGKILIKSTLATIIVSATSFVHIFLILLYIHCVIYIKSNHASYFYIKHLSSIQVDTDSYSHYEFNTAPRKRDSVKRSTN